MSKVCPKCGQNVDDNAIQCPFCLADLNETGGTANTTVPSVNGIANADNNANISRQSTNDSVVNFAPVQSTIASEANETSDTVITNNNVLEEVTAPPFEGVEIDNASLESVSVDANAQSLEKPEEEMIMPTIPEAMIGELSSDLLSKKYEEDERINNERIAEKNRIEEQMRLQQMANEANANAQPMVKPDLLAVGPRDDGNNNNNVSAKKEKKKMNYKKILNIVTLLIMIIIAVCVWYFVLRDSSNKAHGYMEPIDTWYQGYNDSNSSTILSSYVPCLTQNEDVIDGVNNLVSSHNIYTWFTIDYVEERAEVVNSDDQEPLNQYLKDHCDTDIPTITEYKRVYIKQTISNNETKEETMKPQFFTVKIDNKWYILALQEQ